jgi:hypothetical protein
VANGRDDADRILKAECTWDMMPLMVAQKPSRRPPVRVQKRQPRH